MMKRSLANSIVSSFLENLSITNWLIIINVALFIIFYILVAVNPNFISYISLKPLDLLHGKIWQLITSMFMHASIGHLFVNMFSLMFIGNFLERIIGRKRFFLIYIISGVIAGVFFSALALAFGGFLPAVFGASDTIAVGASGALFGLLGVLAVVTPKARVYLIAGPLIAIIIQSIFSFLNTGVFNVISFIVSIYFLFSIFAMISFNPKLLRLALPIEMPFWVLPVIAIVPLFIVGFFIPLPIGNTAHLGGLLAGLAYGWYLRNKYKKKIFILNKMMRTR